MRHSCQRFLLPSQKEIQRQSQQSAALVFGIVSGNQQQKQHHNQILGGKIPGQQLPQKASGRCGRPLRALRGWTGADRWGSGLWYALGSCRFGNPAAAVSAVSLGNVAVIQFLHLPNRPSSAPAWSSEEAVEAILAARMARSSFSTRRWLR